MLFKSLAAAAALGVASAVDVFPVSVGQGPDGSPGPLFSPDRVTVPVGSMVQFQFMGGNHTATQSNFDNPCVPLSTSDTSAVGFHSDWRPPIDGQMQVFTIQINDTNPIWVYCAQGQHCQNGMTMVINESPDNPDRSLDGYRTAAATVEQAQVPDGVVAPGGGQPGQGGQGGQDGQEQPAAASGFRVPAALLAAAAGAAFFL